MSLDANFRPIEPAEFYRAQLKANAVVTSPEDITKFASAHGLPVHVAKLAKLYFEQLVLDGVRYADEVARQDDAIKMAKAYFDQAEGMAQVSTQIADKAVEKLAAAAEELLKAEGIQGVTVAEILKVASLQHQSKVEYEAVEAAKTAGVALTKAKIKVSDAKLAALDISKLDTTKIWHEGIPTPERFLPSAHQYVMGAAGYSGPSPEQLFGQMTNVSHTDPNFREHSHGILAEGFKTPGSTLESAAKSYMATAPGQPNWFSRNSKWLIPAGLLGAGASYLLYRHMKNKEDEKRQQLMSLMASRRQPTG